MESFTDFQFSNFFEPLESLIPVQDTCLSIGQLDEQFEEEFIRDGRTYHKCTFPDCGKIFRFKSEIVRHAVIHLGSRPYTCTQEGCRKTFKRSDALESHMRIHTKEAPFVCPVANCGYKFTNKSGLRYHLLKHKDEKPFKCSFPKCEKVFLTMAQLKQHEKAANYHKKIASIKVQEQVQEEEPLPVEEIHKYVIKDEKEFNVDYFQPIPRPVQKIAWEIKNPENTNTILNENTNYEGLVDHILQENKLLKEKLDLCNKLMEAIKENADLKVQLDQAPPVKSFPDSPPPMFFDDSEFNVLDFLRQKDDQMNPFDLSMGMGLGSV